MRDYQFISPSLEGVLSRSSLVYEGLVRPLEILRVCDGPSAKGAHTESGTYTEVKTLLPEQSKVLEKYFDDLYRIFNKRLADLAVGSGVPDDRALELTAMLQEMIKIKKLLFVAH